MPEGYKKVVGTPDYAFTPNVYEIHGNVKYMHCSNEDEPHSLNFYPAPTLKEVGSQRENYVPKCQECGEIMKPHCMFFDESYSEKYYRSESVDNFTIE